MKPSSAKAKGRRLQIVVAEELSRAFGLRILAEPPTRPGKRPNGAVYVPEGGPAPDLRIRRMGQPGADVVLASSTARGRVAVNGWPLYIECKNIEVWELGKAFWEGRVPGQIASALRQASRGAEKEQAIVAARAPVVVLGRNRWPPVVAYSTETFRLHNPCPATGSFAESGFFQALILWSFLRALDGWKLAGDREAEGDYDAR